MCSFANTRPKSSYTFRLAIISSRCCLRRACSAAKACAPILNLRMSRVFGGLNSARVNERGASYRVRLRAERCAGQLLKEMEKAKGTRRALNQSGELLAVPSTEGQ